MRTKILITICSLIVVVLMNLIVSHEYNNRKENSKASLDNKQKYEEYIESVKEYNGTLWLVVKDDKKWLINDFTTGIKGELIFKSGKEVVLKNNYLLILIKRDKWIHPDVKELLVPVK